MEHPADWELNSVKGNRRSTYLVLDDGMRVRLEVNWRPVPRKAAFEQLVDKQVSVLEKTAKRRRLDIRVKRRRRLGRVRGFEYEAFTWTADVGACELVARCNNCGRVILVRVIGDAERLPTDEARQVFSSLECMCDKDYERWGAFGLDVRVPNQFDLERSSLKAGSCELVFSDKRVELRVVRASMARAILEQEKLVAWYEKLARPFLRPFSVTWSDEPFRGHIGYRGVGTMGISRTLLSFFRGSRKLSVHCFYCDVTDKIFVVAAEGLGDVDDAVETVREGLVCHR